MTAEATVPHVRGGQGQHLDPPGFREVLRAFQAWLITVDVPPISVQQYSGGLVMCPLSLNLNAVHHSLARVGKGRLRGTAQPLSPPENGCNLILQKRKGFTIKRKSTSFNRIYVLTTNSSFFPSFLPFFWQPSIFLSLPRGYTAPSFCRLTQLNSLLGCQQRSLDGQVFFFLQQVLWEQMTPQKRRLGTGATVLGSCALRPAPAAHTSGASCKSETTQVSNTFFFKGGGTVCSCIKGAYMGCSKLLNPQSDQFYLT